MARRLVLALAFAITTIALTAAPSRATDYELRNPGFRRYSLIRPKRLPEDGYRLLVYLHGGGGGEGQAARMWGEHAPQRGYVVIGPASKRSGWCSAGEDLEFVRNVIRAVQREFDVPPARTLFVGYSAGAAATWFYSLPNPKLAAAFCSVNGPVHRKALPYLIRKRKVKALVLSGDSDHNRKSAEMGVRFLKKRGYDVRFGLIRRSGHGYDRAKLNPLILKWFEGAMARMKKKAVSTEAGGSN